MSGEGRGSGSIGVVLLNFGEPETPSLEEVQPFLERIFTANAALEPGLSSVEAARRSRELAERRAPGLVEELRQIGGSPLARQAERQAQALAGELEARGQASIVLLGMQFTEPSIGAAVSRARARGVEALVALPVYPLCGRSTTVAALAALEGEVGSSGWQVPVFQVSGWHRHPAYLELRADAIRRFAETAGLELSSPAARLVFSVHGMPVKYLEEGSRYDLYAEECCRMVADSAGVDDFLLGYQNHANRGIEWTQPEIDDVIGAAAESGARAVVVDAASFMHEQSETLAELDRDLRGRAEEVGLQYYRVPVPHDDPRFAGVLADLVQAALRGGGSGPVTLRRCRCTQEALCLNG